MKPRRGDGLAVLSRLKRFEMENVALEMAEVNRALTQIENERHSLMEQLNDRGDPDAVESTRVVSAFIRNVSETIHRKEAEAERLRADSALPRAAPRVAEMREPPTSDSRRRCLAADGQTRDRR